MSPKTCLTRLLGAALLLPIAIVVLAAFGQLLKALGDQSGGTALLRLALGGGIAWVLTLIGLLLAVAVRQVRDGSSCPADDEAADQ